MEAIEAEVLDSGRRDTKGRRMLGEHEWNRLLDEYEKKKKRGQLSVFCID
jgi:hypothetical protein